jgi:translation initiation factor IF-2
MSGGRTHTVVVEKRRRRILTPAEIAKQKEQELAAQKAAEQATVKAEPAKAEAPVAAPAPAKPAPAAVDRLTSDERDARAQALASAMEREKIEDEEIETLLEENR